MTLNITSNSRSRSSNEQASLFQGDLVYLYGDTNYTGRLINPVERTYPPKWTVQLDRGGYEAVNIVHISVAESRNNQHELKGENNYNEADLHIPFSDGIEPPVKSRSRLEAEIAALRRENTTLQQENDLIDKRYRELEQQNALLKEDLNRAKQIIRRAKNIAPLIRISLKRVLRLAHDTCMDVRRTVGGWILRMGDKARKFRRLADIWDLLSVDEFILSEVFPEEKLIAIDLIQPPKRRRKPEAQEKRTFPLMRPEDIMRNRTMLLVKSG